MRTIAGIMYDKSLDTDIRSLRQTILYGLKGISAYGHQARELGNPHLFLSNKIGSITRDTADFALALKIY